MYILTDDSVIFHPGYYLFEIMHSRKISVEDLSEKTGINDDEISDVLSGRKDISKIFATKLYDYFGISPSYWMNLQNEYDAKCRELRDKELRYRIVR